MASRFDAARNYRIDLLRAYGHRPIIVKIANDGEEVQIMAKNFVKRQLSTANIYFPYNETNKKNTKIINSDLDNDELSIIFHQAVFDFETAYVEEFCQGKPKAEAYINSIYNWIERKQEWLRNTFYYYNVEELVPFLTEETSSKLSKGDLSADLEITEEDVKLLKQMGYKQISSVQAMMQLFWNFASNRIPISKLMKNAILSITVDEEAADYLTSYFRFYNRFIQERIESEAFPSEEKVIKELNKKHQAELLQISKKQQQELNEYKKKYKEETTALNRKHQEDLKNKVQKSKDKAKKYGTVVRKFRQELLNPHGKFHKTYDLTKEEDIKDFISWFSIIHRKIKNQTVKNIVKMTFSEDEDKAELFKRMVDDYNNSLLADNDSGDELDED